MEPLKFIECINTYQGEGPDTGKRVALCRFKRCNLVDEEGSNPCRWCDTLIKMRVQKESYIDFNELQEMITNEKLGLMITGGEPLYNDQFCQTIRMLSYLEYPFANVETNGYNMTQLLVDMPKDKPIKIIYSPKIFNQQDLDRELYNANLVKSRENIYFKVVIDHDNIGPIESFLQYLYDKDLNNRTYLMPLGSNREELINNFPETIDYAEKYKFNISSREHLIYNFI